MVLEEEDYARGMGLGLRYMQLAILLLASLATTLIIIDYPMWLYNMEIATAVVAVAITAMTIAIISLHKGPAPTLMPTRKELIFACLLFSFMVTIGVIGNYIVNNM